MRKNGFSFIIVSAMLLIISTYSFAQDWPQWRGVQRDGIVKKADINLDWSMKKPPLAWSFKQAGMGYSSPAIVGTTLYCQGALNNKGFAFALDAQTGALKWKQELGDEIVEDRENAPRGTITVDGDKLYMIRGIGQIHCLSATDGKTIWAKDFKKDFNGVMMSRWGYSESPLIDGNLVICSPGGDDGAIIALDKNTGAVVWRVSELKDKASHSSPIVAVVDGVRQYIQTTSKSVVGISKDGKLLWKVDVPAFRTAVIPTPIYKDNMVYVTSGYNAGCVGIKLTRSGDAFSADTLYSNRNMVNHHGGVVLVDGNIYGYSDPSGWVCQNFKTGETVWKERNSEVAKGAVLAINDRLILLNERNGLLTLIAASPDGWKEFGRIDFPERTQISTTDNAVWPHPVFANDKLYVRDHDLMFCFDLKK